MRKTYIAGTVKSLMEEKQEGPEGKQTRKLPELRLTFVSQKKEKERILAPQKKGIKLPIEHVDTLRSFQRKMDEAVSTVSSKIRLRYVRLCQREL